MAVDQDPRIERPRVLLLVVSCETLREVLYILLSLGLGSAGIAFVLWRKAIVEGKLESTKKDFVRVTAELSLARDLIASQKLAAVTTLANYEQEISNYKSQIETLNAQRDSAIEALERFGAPGALRGLLRAKLGLPPTGGAPGHSDGS